MDTQGFHFGPQEQSAAQLLMSNPELMAAFSSQLESMIGSSSGYIESLPKAVRRRVRALKKIQSEHAQLEVQFHNEVAELERKFESLFAPLYQKRKDIITGALEPTDEDCDYGDPEDDEDHIEVIEDDAESSNNNAEDAEDEGSPSGTKKVEGTVGEETSTDDGDKDEDDEDDESESASGIKDFWLTCLSNHPLISEMIQDSDFEALGYLTDIRVELIEGNNTGFKLLFHFAENPFFENSVLTKVYHTKPELGESELMYEGPIFQHAEGTEIQWKEGKNLTQKLIKKKQRKKTGPRAGETRITVKAVEQESFFNFFSPPAVDGIDPASAAAQELAQLVHEDYAIGDIVKEKLIPHAVLWFTGEAHEYEEYEHEEDEDDDGWEDDDDEDDDDDDDDEDDPSFEPPQGNAAPECKQS